ncbi:MAG: G5 domain-containing protein [Oscillospiraceae bacterium]|nr:G5 domain-containing protein [Oscillospiraceae bacterium]
MRIFKALMLRKTLLIRISVLALALILPALLLTQTVFAKNTYVITDGDEVLVHNTYATDPAAVLEEAGVTVGETDIIETTPVEDGAEITIVRGMQVTVDYCGQEIQLVSYGETVSELFDRSGIALNENSRVSVALDTQTFDGLQIVVNDTITATEVYTMTVPYETVYQETDALVAGAEVVLYEGVDGQTQYTAKVTYVNGKENGREVLSEDVISEPVTKVVALGTGDGSGSKSQKPIIGDGVIIAPNGDVLTYTHRDTYVATAYSRTCEGGEITAIGTPTRVGAIAVDPRLIPYGTRMFIVSKDGRYIYGVATAEDCGGSIKGKRIDLFYETRSECLTFGMRDIDVYFLG